MFRLFEMHPQRVCKIGKMQLAPEANKNDDTGLFPAIAQAIRITLALPVTTRTIERSFSTLRRVKT